MHLRLSTVVVMTTLACWAGSGGAADDLSSLVAPYLEAQKRQPVGEITGHAYAESRRRQAPPMPYSSVMVRLLPYSAQFEAQLGVIKSGLRDSLKNYGEAVTRFEDARTAYERALLEAGGGALVRDGATDATGTFRLTEVPRGDWLLVAWRETGHVRKTSKPGQGGVDQYADIPITVDYSTVTYWLRRVSVTPGEATDVMLSDRAVWMTAVRQEVLSTSSGRPKKWGSSPVLPPGTGTPAAPGAPLPPGGALSAPR